MENFKIWNSQSYFSQNIKAAFGDLCPKSIWDKSQFYVPMSKTSEKIMALLFCQFWVPFFFQQMQFKNSGWKMILFYSFEKFPSEQLGLCHNIGITYIWSIVLKLMPCPFTDPKRFCAGPNFLCRTKDLFTYCGSHKHFVPDKNMICIQ